MNWLILNQMLYVHVSTELLGRLWETSEDQETNPDLVIYDREYDGSLDTISMIQVVGRHEKIH